MNKIIGLYSNDATQTELMIRDVLREGYNQPIIFSSSDYHTKYTRQFKIVEARSIEEAQQLTIKHFGKRADFGVWERPFKKEDTVKQVKSKAGKIRVGFILYCLSSGGIPRHVLTMMEAPAPHNLEWSGVAISTSRNIDDSTACKIGRYCTIYALEETEYTQRSGNPFQSVIDNSDVIYLTGFVEPNFQFSMTDFRNKPVIAMAHGQCEFTTRQIETALQYGGSNICMAVSRGASEMYSQSREVHVIHNGVNYSRCAPVVTREEIRREWGIPSGIKAVGYIGRLAHDKNPLAAAQAVRQLGKNYHAVYVGNGYAKAQYVSQVKDLCGERCTFIDQAEDIGSILAALDCIVVASPLEGGPMVVSEAWLAECPVVATQVGMIPEMEEKYGALTFRIPAEPTPTQISKGVRKAVRGGNVVQRARDAAWREFNPSKQVLRFESIIRDHLKKSDINSVKRVGFCIGTLSMGGVTRGMISLMNEGAKSLEWSGVSIEGSGTFDPETAKSILRHCPIYCSHDDEKFQGLVTIVQNACQKVIEESDVVKLWGHINRRPEMDAAEWAKVTVITAAHGQCEWTRKNVDLSLEYGDKHILYSVSKAGVKCFPDQIQGYVNIIYNGLDFDRCTPKKRRSVFRSELGIGDEVIIIAHIGRFSHDKNPLAVAQAVRELGEGYHGLYVGEGYHHEDVVRSVNSLGNCTILPRSEDVGTILNAVDCIVLASPSEGCPQIMMEAFGARCPVVSTRVGFLPEFEEEYGTLAWQVPFHPSPKQLADAVFKALQDQKTTERAYKAAVEKFNIRNHAKAFEKMIHSGTPVRRLGNGN